MIAITGDVFNSAQFLNSYSAREIIDMMQAVEMMANSLTMHSYKNHKSNGASMKLADSSCFAIARNFESVLKYLVEVRVNECYGLFIMNYSDCAGKHNDRSQLKEMYMTLRQKQRNWVTEKLAMRQTDFTKNELFHLKKLVYILMLRLGTSYRLMKADYDESLLFPGMFYPTVKIEGTPLAKKISPTTTLKHLLKDNPEAECPVCQEYKLTTSNSVIQSGCRHLICTRCAEKWYILSNNR